MQPKPIRRRILNPNQHCTQIPNWIFTDDLMRLRKTGCSSLPVHDRLGVPQSGVVIDTRAELASAINIDERVVKKYVAGIWSKGFIELQREGLGHPDVCPDSSFDNIGTAPKAVLLPGHSPSFQFVWRRIEAVERWDLLTSTRILVKGDSSEKWEPARTIGTVGKKGKLLLWI